MLITMLGRDRLRSRSHKITISQPEGDIDERDEGGNFDEGADDADKCFAGVEAEDSDRRQR